MNVRLSQRQIAMQKLGTRHRRLNVSKFKLDTQDTMISVYEVVYSKCLSFLWRIHESNTWKLIEGKRKDKSAANQITKHFTFGNYQLTNQYYTYSEPRQPPYRQHSYGKVYKAAGPWKLCCLHNFWLANKMLARPAPRRQIVTQCSKHRPRPCLPK